MTKCGLPRLTSYMSRFTPEQDLALSIQRSTRWLVWALCKCNPCDQAWDIYPWTTATAWCSQCCYTPILADTTTLTGNTLPKVYAACVYIRRFACRSDYQCGREFDITTILSIRKHKQGDLWIEDKGTKPACRQVETTFAYMVLKLPLDKSNTLITQISQAFAG